MGKKRIVLDTSVFICGLLSKGTSNEILKLILDKKVLLLLTEEILREYVKVIFYQKFKFDRSYALAFLRELSKKSMSGDTKEHFNLCRDKEDDKFLDIVYASKADFLITLDKDLLELRDENKEFQIKEHKFQILRPEEFLGNKM